MTPDPKPLPEAVHGLISELIAAAYNHGWADAAHYEDPVNTRDGSDEKVVCDGDEKNLRAAIAHELALRDAVIVDTWRNFAALDRETRGR